MHQQLSYFQTESAKRYIESPLVSIASHGEFYKEACKANKSDVHPVVKRWGGGKAEHSRGHLVKDPDLSDSNLDSLEGRARAASFLVPTDRYFQACTLLPLARRLVLLLVKLQSQELLLLLMEAPISLEIHRHEILNSFYANYA